MTFKVLVTGIRGFTGAYVKTELETFSYEVFGLEQLNGKSIEQVNLLDESRLRELIDLLDPTYVIHLAGSAHATDVQAIDLYKNNILGTYNLLEAVARKGRSIEKIIIASSGAVYKSKQINKIHERSLLEPASHYAASKLAVELICRQWEKELPIIVVRPFNYTGRNQASNYIVPKLIKGFREVEAKLTLGNLSVRRDFSDVRDVAVVYRRLLIEGKPCEVYNICSGRSISIVELIKKLEGISGRRIEVESNESLIRSNEARELVGNPRKINALLKGFHRRAFDETLLWMYEK